MQKGILFDKDGTLLNFEAFWIPVAEGALSALAHKFCVSAETVQVIEEKLGVHCGRANRNGIFCSGTYSEIAEVVRGVFSEYGTETAKKEMYRALCCAFSKNLQRGKIIPTTLELRSVLCWLKNDGYKLFVATTDKADITVTCLHTLGIEDLFDEVYTDGMEYPIKPNPYIIGDIINKYSVARENLIMVGDTYTDILFARNGCISAIGYAKDEEGKQLLLPFADTVIDDLSELPKILKDDENYFRRLRLGEIRWN